MKITSKSFYIYATAGVRCPRPRVLRMEDNHSNKTVF